MGSGLEAFPDPLWSQKRHQGGQLRAMLHACKSQSQGKIEVTPALSRNGGELSGPAPKVLRTFHKGGLRRLPERTPCCGQNRLPLWFQNQQPETAFCPVHGIGGQKDIFPDSLQESGQQAPRNSIPQMGGKPVLQYLFIHLPDCKGLPVLELGPVKPGRGTADSRQ